MMSEFASIVSHFSFRRNSVEEAFCGPILQRQSTEEFGEHSFRSISVNTPIIDGMTELAYILKYPENKAPLSTGGEPWVIRQIGIYQKFNKLTGKSVWVLLCCQPDSPAYKLVKKVLEERLSSVSALRYPVVLHLTLVSCYLYNWRDYMLYYETELLKKVCSWSPGVYWLMFPCHKCSFN
jgi:hypothetical protein